MCHEGYVVVRRGQLDMEQEIDFTTITPCGECCVGCQKKEAGICQGCIESDGNCKEWTESGGCPIYKCAKEHQVQFCGLCSEFPCSWLSKTITWNPNIVEHQTSLSIAYKIQISLGEKGHDMKVIVVYKSKSGYTKTYAEWIAEELKCDLRQADEISVDDLKQYDVIIYGGGLYAVGINGISLIKKNYSLLHNKKIVVWATGSSPGRENQQQEVWNHNFPETQFSSIKKFYLRGGFDYTKLNTGDKILMSMLKIRLKSKRMKNEDEQGMLAAYDIPEYHCNKENIHSLVEYVRKLEAE